MPMLIIEVKDYKCLFPIQAGQATLWSQEADYQRKFNLGGFRRTDHHTQPRAGKDYRVKKEDRVKGCTVPLIWLISLLPLHQRQTLEEPFWRK